MELMLFWSSLNQGLAEPQIESSFTSMYRFFSQYSLHSTNIYWTPAMCLVLHCTLTAPEWMGHNSFITRWLQPRESIFHHFTIAIPSVMFCKLERAQYVWSHRVNWLLLPHVSILCYNYSISLIIWQIFFSDSHVKL